MNKYSIRPIQNKQTPLADALQDIPPFPRLVLGLLLSAIVAFYAPLLLLVLTNSRNNILGDWVVNSICVAVLMLINLVSNKFGRVMPVAAVLAIVFNVYVVSLTMRTHTLGDWQNYWQNFFFTTVVFPLNGYLFLKYKQAASL